MKGRVLAIAVLFASLAPADAQVQQPAAPEPILRVTIDPPRVVVGQKATLRIDVLAPNYMTAPPVLPDFQVRNAVTRQLRSINQSERRRERPMRACGSSSRSIRRSPAPTRSPIRRSR